MLRIGMKDDVWDRTTVRIYVPAGHFETSSVHGNTSRKYSVILIQSDVKYTQTL